MKKILVAFVIGCMAMVMTSCSDNSPKGVAIQAVKCMQQKDFKGYVDLLNLPDATDEPNRSTRRLAPHASPSRWLTAKVRNKTIPSTW